MAEGKVEGQRGQASICVSEHGVRVLPYMTSTKYWEFFTPPPSLSAKSTVLVLRIAHRKRKEIEQQPSMLLGTAVPGGCLVSFYFLLAILSTCTVVPTLLFDILGSDTPPMKFVSSPSNIISQLTSLSRHK